MFWCKKDELTILNITRESSKYPIIIFNVTFKNKDGDVYKELIHATYYDRSVDMHRKNKMSYISNGRKVPKHLANVIYSMRTILDNGDSLTDNITEKLDGLGL